MFNLIPWKKNSNDGKVGVWRERPEYYSLAQFRNEVDSLFDRFWSDWGAMTRWGDDWNSGFRDGLEDKAEEYVFHAELPGFKEDEIDVNVSGNTLTVRAEHKNETNGDEGRHFHYGVYQRMFTLPYGVDESNIDARYHNGVLDIRLPKTEDAKGKRIPVTAA